MGLQNVETSPHIIMPDTVASGILNNMFPGMFAEVQRDAKEVFISKRLGKVVIPLRNCASVSIVRHFVHWIEGEEHSLPIKIVLFLAWPVYSTQKRWRYNRCKTIYPVNGLDEWYASIQTRLNALKAKVKLRHTVSGLEITTDPKRPTKHPVKISLADGAQLLTDQVFITEALYVSKFKIDGKTIPVNYEGRHTQHLTMLVDGESVGEFWMLTGDDKFEMVNDVTAYVRTNCDQFRSKRVIAARLNRRRLYLEEDFDLYTSRLADVGYLNNSFTIVDHVVRNLQEQRMCSATKSRIAQLSNHSCIILEAGEKSMEAAIRHYFGRRST